MSAFYVVISLLIFYKGQQMKVQLTALNSAKLQQLTAQIKCQKAKLGEAIEAIEQSECELGESYRKSCEKGYKIAKWILFARYERDLLKDNIALNKVFALSDKSDSCVIKAFFKNHNSDRLSNKIFDKTFAVAQNRNVKVVFVVDKGGAKYLPSENLIKMLSNDLPKAQNAMLLLHALIHSVSVQALRDFESANLCAKNALNIIAEIQDLYQITKAHEMTLKVWCNRKCYGLMNLKEFLADLANPLFRDSLAKIGILESVVEKYYKFLESNLTNGGAK